MKSDPEPYYQSSLYIFRFFSLPVIISLMIGFQYCKAQNANSIYSNYAHQLDEIMTNYYNNGNFQGAVMVVMKQKIVYANAFGYANIEWKIPNEIDTRFTIASLGKAFTAAIVMQLVEEGKIKLKDPISKHLSSYRKDIGNRVTIHQILRHTSGIPWQDPDLKRSYTFEDLVQQANKYDLLFEPGTEFNYSNTGYNLLGAMIEEITGNSFAQELHNRILIPCQMSNTGLVKHRPILEKRASGYDRLPGGELLNAEWQDQSYAMGAGGMYSTVGDLYKWDQALYNDDFLSLESRELMFTPGLRNAGYGWNIGKYKKNKIEGLGTLVNGFGSTRGFSSIIARLLDDQYFIVALANINQVPQGSIANDIWNTILDFDVETTISFADSIYQITFNNGVEAAVLNYNEILESHGKNSVPTESSINRAGYALLSLHGRIEDAIKLFKLNVSLFPISANVYDSLGEAYKIQGDIQLAIENYERALQLNPQMQSAKDALERLRKN